MIQINEIFSIILFLGVLQIKFILRILDLQIIKTDIQCIIFIYFIIYFYNIPKINYCLNNYI